VTLPPDYTKKWLDVSKAKKNEEIIQSIRDMHQQFYDWCIICRDPQNPEHNAQFPCDTRKITDGISTEKTLDAPELLTFDFGDW
jgi:hypothetical protein